MLVLSQILVISIVVEYSDSVCMFDNYIESVELSNEVSISHPLEIWLARYEH